MPIHVPLEWHEFSVAAHVGQLRSVEAIRGGMRRHDGTIPSMHEEVEGAAAEMVVAKALNIYWDGSVNCFDRADLPGLHIRHTIRNDGHLIVRPKDRARYSDGDRFVLVVGQRCQYALVGSIRLEDACQDRFKRNPRGLGSAFFVPQQELEEFQSPGYAVVPSPPPALVAA